MAKDHDEEEGAEIIKLTGGVVRVHEVGSGQQVDHPDIAARGMDAFSRAIGSAGGKIVGPVKFERPGDTSADDAVLEALDFPVDPNDHLPD